MGSWFLFVRVCPFVFGWARVPTAHPVRRLVLSFVRVVRVHVVVRMVQCRLHPSVCFTWTVGAVLFVGRVVPPATSRVAGAARFLRGTVETGDLAGDTRNTVLSACSAVVPRCSMGCAHWYYWCSWFAHGVRRVDCMCGGVSLCCRLQCSLHMRRSSQRLRPWPPLPSVWSSTAGRVHGMIRTVLERGTSHCYSCAGWVSAVAARSRLVVRNSCTPSMWSVDECSLLVRCVTAILACTGTSDLHVLMSVIWFINRRYSALYACTVPVCRMRWSAARAVSAAATG